MLVQTARSYENLRGVRPPLVFIAIHACLVTEDKFSIVSGLRTEKEQRELYHSKRSWTLQSRHLTGDAFDVAAFTLDGDYQTDDRSGAYSRFAQSVAQAAKMVGQEVRWGGEWRVKDYAHFELSPI